MVEGLHDLLVGNGWATPLEFWQLTPGQAWWVVRARMPKQAAAREDKMSTLYTLLKEAKAKETVNG